MRISEIKSFDNYMHVLLDSYTECCSILPQFRNESHEEDAYPGKEGVSFTNNLNNTILWILIGLVAVVGRI